MALFGRSKEGPKIGIVEPFYEQDEKVKKALIAKVNENKQYLEALNATQGVGAGGLLAANTRYKLQIEEDKYCFHMMSIPSEYELGNYAIADIEAVADYKPIELDRARFTCELIKESPPLEMSQKIVGEGSLKMNPIKILFRDTETGQESIFEVQNSPQNIAPYAGFFKELGVKNYYNVLEIPEEIFSIKVQNGNGFLATSATYLAYRNKGVLTLIRPGGTSFYNNKTIYIAEIGIAEIIYYKSDGSIRYEQMVTGEGGAENSYTGAIVGGLLFGAAGAIIGSRANETKTEISTKTITHDTRILVLNIRRNNVTYSIGLDLAAEQVLEWLIPEKQYDYVIQKRREMYEKDPLK